MRIRVERPLRLTFAITDERITALRIAPVFEGLAKSRKKGAAATDEIAAGEATQDAILAALEAAKGDRRWPDREAFTAHLKAVLRAVKPAPALLNAIALALAQRDEAAPPVTGRGGQPEPDADLRDYENVPLTHDIAAYLAREVLPHAPDAWEDATDRRRGCEIPFTRFFYRYNPPRPLAEIDADLRRLSAEITEMLREITA